MKKFLLALAFLLLISTVSAERLYTWGHPDAIELDVNAKSLQGFDRLKFVYSDKGHFEVYKQGIHQGRISFGLFGELNGTPEKRLMSDFNWTWEVLNESDNNIVVRGYNNFPQFNWWMTLTVGKYESLKIAHIIENNTAFDLVNAQVFYLVDVNQETSPYAYYKSRDGNVYVYDYSVDKHYTQADTNFEQYYDRVSFPGMAFLFKDLIQEDFFVTRAFFGNLGNLDTKLPDVNGFVVGLSRGNGVFPSGGQVFMDPTLSLGSDNLDGFVQWNNGSYELVDLTELHVGNDYVGGGPMDWRRTILIFDITGLGTVLGATLYLDYETKLQETTGDFNIVSINAGATIDSTDYEISPIETVNALWFDETISGDQTQDVTTAWNNNVDGALNYLDFRIALINEAGKGQTKNDELYVEFYDTGEGGTDPYINYSLTVPDVNIWQVDGWDFNAVLPSFNYSDDGNLAIKFRVEYPAGDDLNFNMWYSTTQNLKENKIIGDINLSTDTSQGKCDTNSRTTGMVCSWDFNISPKIVADANYWITIEINPAAGDSNTSSAEKSFAVDNNPIECGTTITSSTTLVGDVTDCPGDGITINGSNITLDCDGYSITSDGSAVAGDYGIYINTGSGTTVKNCVVDDFYSGIFSEFSSADNTILYNNEIKNNNDYGVRFYFSDNLHIEKNKIHDNSSIGIEINNDTNVTIIDNNIYSNGDSTIDWGLYLQVAGAPTTISDNNISDNERGVYAWLADNAIFSNNIINNSSSTGMQIRDSDFLSISNCSITNTPDGNGISFETGALGGSVNTAFYDSNISNNAVVDIGETFGTNYDYNVHLIDTPFSSIYLLSGSKAYIGWWVDVTVKDSSTQLAIENATVNFSDKSHILRHTDSTNASGKINTTPIFDYNYVDSNATKNYYSPWDINVTATGYDTNGLTVSVDANQELVIYMDSTGGNSCSCPASGWWEIVGGDVCTLATVCELTGGGLYISSGSLNIASSGLLSVPTGYQILLKQSSGNFLSIEQGGFLVIKK